ncbi:hypothetical protein CC78DRAFT_566334 [Lojkania enalia]|uniref:Heterokaryon incompatibility domain-containing protein n=1 Tax=Lojkania enalia TaxID=147567 RepID=A0A9P4KIF9_9PLEO|nr:hypothetical protein CC78DRAFT_566334 [Didymosphaeria enalia]
MDSIPLPLDSYPGIDVPLLETFPYDFKGLDDFPVRLGFGNSPWTTLEETPTKAASVLQSWLYFALLSEFLQSHVNPEDLSCYDQRQPFFRKITLKPVTSRLVHSNRKDEIGRRYSLVKGANRLLRSIESIPLCQSNTTPVAEVTLSIRLLLLALWPYSGQPALSFRPHPLISKRLKDNGWCPSHIRRIESLNDTVTGYYLSCLRRPNPQGFSHIHCPTTNCQASSTTLSKDYVSQHTHKNLVSCSLVHVSQDSIRDIIRVGGIPLVWIDESSSGAPQLHVRSATARDNYIAISHVWSDGLGNPQSNALPMCQVKKLARYLTQLPHPSTQGVEEEFRSTYSFGPISIDIGRLSLICRLSARPILFWMDTLCIPISTNANDIETNELKKKAINQMALIYGRASQVLVLDSSLQQSRLSVMNNNELLARIAFSNWMGRSWTLQEGALSPFVYFQFADGAINLLDILPRSSNKVPSPLVLHPVRFRLAGVHDALVSILWAWRHGNGMRAPNSSPEHFIIYCQLYSFCMSSFHVTGLDRPENWVPKAKSSLNNAQWVQELVAVWNALSFRTTTMEEDLPAIVANLLGFSASQILSLPSEQRVSAILDVGDEVPVSLLYNRGARLKPTSNHYGRWIPTAIGRCQQEEAPVMRVDAKRNLFLNPENMLQTAQPTLMLLRAQLPITIWSLPVTASNGAQYRVTVHRGSNDALETSSFSWTGFLIAKGFDQACCIRLNLQDENYSFHGLYDCPCTIELIDTDTSISTEADQYHFQTLDKWEILILGDTKAPLIRKSRVSHRALQSMLDPSGSTKWLIRLIAIWFPLIPLLIVSTVLRIYIASSLPWSNLSSLGRASLILFALQRIPSPSSVIPTPQVLFVLDQISTKEGMRNIDIAYVVLDTIWIIYMFAAFVLMAQQWVQCRFELTLSSLDQESKDGSNIGEFWTKVKRRMPRFLGQAMEAIERHAFAND